MISAIKRILQVPKEAQPDDKASDWAHQNSSTPDLWMLEQYIRQIIFVPCDMKVGGKNHHLIEEAINGPVLDEHKAVYTADEYTLWLKDLGEHRFPVPLSKDYRPDAFTIVPVESAPIEGELYFIRPSQFVLLDKHKQNGVQFTRKRVTVRIPYRSVSYSKLQPLPRISAHCFYTLPAWMYVGVQDYWDPQIGGIFKSQMDLYEHDTKRVWIDKFYKFETG